MLIEIRPHQFLSPASQDMFSLSTLIYLPTLKKIASVSLVIIVKYTIHLCACVFVCVCTCVCVCVWKYTYNKSPFVFYVYMVSRPIFLHCTAKTSDHAWERLILLLLVIFSFLYFITRDGKLQNFLFFMLTCPLILSLF